MNAMETATFWQKLKIKQILTYQARPVFYNKIMIYVWTSSVYRKRQNIKLVKMTSPMQISRCRHSTFLTEIHEPIYLC